MSFDATARWEGGAATRLTDDRGHEVLVDLPADEGGLDSGTSALELSVLSLAGCIVTIFLLVARRRRLPVESLSVALTAERGPHAPTVEAISGALTIRSGASDEEVATVLRLTLRTCPVGVLFEKAGVPVRVRIEREAAGTPVSSRVSAPASRAY